MSLSFLYTAIHIPRTVPNNRRPGTLLRPETITIHSTANPNSTAINERNWLVNPQNSRTASWHIAVDEKEAVEAIPLNEVAYHAGNASGNRTSIGIEICESGNRQRTLANAIELTAHLLKQRNWGIERLRRHFDWSGKSCPRILMENNWQGWRNFLSEVEKALDPRGSVPSRPTPTPHSEFRLDTNQLIRRGDRGENVKFLQEYLNQLKHNAGATDGIFGVMTQRAVQSFQRNNRLAVDGVAGPNTLSKMKEIIEKDMSYSSNVFRVIVDRQQVIALTGFENARDYAIKHYPGKNVILQNIQTGEAHRI